MQSNEPRKPDMVAEMTDLAPLEFVHSKLCEMNDELTKGGKIYFIMLIDYCARFCYVYLLETKDKVLH